MRPDVGADRNLSKLSGINQAGSPQYFASIRNACVGTRRHERGPIIDGSHRFHSSYSHDSFQSAIPLTVFAQLMIVTGMCYAGIFFEGIGCVLAGVFGAGCGLTSISQNIGAIGITGVRINLYSVLLGNTSFRSHSVLVLKIITFSFSRTKGL